ncbi:protein INCA1 [Amia ocellicauda]|uniref:protein INCA1 n=1 Tax=Amia ocellicauda TaxID=2972642 RepID=UPI003463AB45
MLHPVAAGGHGSVPLTRAADQDSCQFFPFAKTSRIVRRGFELQSSGPPSGAALPPPCQRSHEFWDRIHQQPMPGSTHEDCVTVFSQSYEQYSTVGGAAVRRPRPDSGRRARTRQKEAGPERLPSLSELCGRRRRGLMRSGAPRDGRMVAVLRHLEELKKRQSAINQMKGEKWGGSTGTRLPKESCVLEEELGEEGGEGLLEPSLGVGPRGPPSPTATPFPPTPPAHHQQQLLIGGGGGEEACLAPGGNPMMSFVLRPMDRQLQGAGFPTSPSHKEFWGFAEE